MATFRSTPPTEPLLRVVQAMDSCGITCALGGSGLLYFLGLVEEVRDWDLTTDAPFEQVQAALGAFSYARAPHSDDPFATAYRLALEAGDQEIDLIGKFAIRTEAGVCHLPAVVVRTHGGIPVGSPEVWAVAYRLMNRHAKADILSEYLCRTGADPAVIALLLEQPLPRAVRQEVLDWE